MEVIYQATLPFFKPDIIDSTNWNFVDEDAREDLQIGVLKKIYYQL